MRAIGLLDSPPPSVLAKIDERERREPVAANLFRESAVWQPLLEPLITRLSLKVRTWQLGADSDYSFLGRSNLKKMLKDIARELQGLANRWDLRYRGHGWNRCLHRPKRLGQQRN